MRLKHFLNRKWPVLVGAAALTALVALVALSWLSITIRSYPSCLTYQSDGNLQLGQQLRASFSTYLAAKGFSASVSGDDVTWDSRATFIQWGSDPTLWLNVCTKNEASSDWIAIAQDLQKLALPAHWTFEAWLALNPDVTGCRRGNDLRLEYPVDFKKMGMSIEHIKATCAGRRHL
jgi:hypothetical protein